MKRLIEANVDTTNRSADIDEVRQELYKYLLHEYFDEVMSMFPQAQELNGVVPGYNSDYCGSDGRSDVCEAGYEAVEAMIRAITEMYLEEHPDY